MDEQHELHYVRRLLQEAFDLLTPIKPGGSDWCNREEALRSRIGCYLTTHGGLTLTGGGGGGGVGGWAAGGFKYVSGGASVTTGFGGAGHDQSLQRANELGKPVCFGGGGGGGQRSFAIWAFPDGHTETLEIGETPRWPKENPVRDAVMKQPGLIVANGERIANEAAGA